MTANEESDFADKINNPRATPTGEPQVWVDESAIAAKGANAQNDADSHGLPTSLPTGLPTGRPADLPPPPTGRPADLPPPPAALRTAAKPASLSAAPHDATTTPTTSSALAQPKNTAQPINTAQPKNTAPTSSHTPTTSLPDSSSTANTTAKTIGTTWGSTRATTTGTAKSAATQYTAPDPMNYAVKEDTAKRQLGVKKSAKPVAEAKKAGPEFWLPETGEVSTPASGSNNAVEIASAATSGDDKDVKKPGNKSSKKTKNSKNRNSKFVQPDKPKPVKVPAIKVARQPIQREGVGKKIFWIASCLIFAICLTVTVVAIWRQTGPTGLLIGFATAIIPVAPMMAAFWWLNRYASEPWSSMLFAFAWGACVATLISLTLNTMSAIAFAKAGTDPNITAFAVAPIVEEVTKALGILAVLALRRRQFDGIMDGIVYAGMCALGFAFIENVLYFGRSYMMMQASGLIVTFIMRAIMSPFAHPLFTMMTGIGIGLAASRRDWFTRIVAPLGFLLIAIELHAIWNGSAMIGMASFLLVYALLQIPIFVGAIVFVLLVRRRQGKVLRHHLAAYQESGWLTTHEARMIGSLRERRQAKAWALRAFPNGGKAMKQFQNLGIKVCLLRERMSRGTAPQDAADLEMKLLDKMHEQRLVFAG